MDLSSLRFLALRRCSGEQARSPVYGIVNFPLGFAAFTKAERRLKEFSIFNYMKTPRGIRNNNPLNIRVGNDWQGERKPNTDGAFEQFTTMQYGYRAAFKLLKAYIEKHHCRTIRFIINRWAPPKENDTNAYLKRVVEISGLNPDAVIAFSQKQTMIDLAYAMTIVENGVAVDKEVIAQGYALAEGSVSGVK